MKFISKIESGYLQLLRVAFLVVATIVLVCAVVLGIQAFSDHSARPAPVSTAISIDPQAFSLKSDSAGSDTSAAADTQATGTAGHERAKLADQLQAVLMKHGKKLIGPDFSVNSQGVRGVVDVAADNPDLGEAFVSARTQYVDSVLSRADVMKKIGGSYQQFIEIFDEACDQYQTSYLSEKNSIAAKQAAAQAEADARHIAAWQSLTVIGSLIGTFVVLVLLLVLFRVDRSIRDIALAQNRQSTVGIAGRGDVRVQ